MTQLNFFQILELTPVFPPMQNPLVQKCAGKLIKFIPLLKILETKPDMSPIIPPPIPIIKSDLLKFNLSNLLINKFILVKIFNFF